MSGVQEKVFRFFLINATNLYFPCAILGIFKGVSNPEIRWTDKKFMDNLNSLQTI